MSRDPHKRIEDILEAVDKCQRYFSALGEDPEFEEMAADAIERNLQIIGEATNHLPAEITDVHPEIAWPQIRGFRNILVHQYFPSLFACRAPVRGSPRDYRSASPRPISSRGIRSASQRWFGPSVMNIRRHRPRRSRRLQTG